MQVPITTSYVQMTSPDQLRPRRLARDGLALVPVRPPIPELNRFFYTAVGGDWYWLDRLPWSRQRWLAYLDRPELETWLLTVAGVPAGYCELEMQPDQQVEVAYFGLLPAFVGQGLGSHFLTAVVERAWAWGASRVWLHTCTLDHPTALAHYQARGFQLYRQETRIEELPEQPVGPWPGWSEPRTQLCLPSRARSAAE